MTDSAIFSKIDPKKVQSLIASRILNIKSLKSDYS